MTLEQIALKLPQRQSEVIRILISNGVGGQFVSSRFLAERLGRRLKAIQANIEDLRDNLFRTRWRIEAVNQEGYRLVLQS